jgi:TusA-related sulfurtransferase
VNTLEHPFHASETDDDGKTFEVQRHLDTRGMTCPMPALKTLAQCKEMKLAEILEVVGDWPGSLLEVPFAVTGKPDLEIVRIVEPKDESEETWWIYVRKTR